ncbi:hypothetical protein KP509_26G052100 [Ceratopteris richardii]|nr:hypothetical protein KP509_26G052100 [Ceratopteris richardii]
MKVRRNSDNTCNNMHQILNPERSSHSPSSKTIRGGLARLRRAATDPQITEHLGHYKTQVIDAHSTQGKLYHGVHRSCSMSLPAERWAGPAFISSPAPSSLPLPKFSLISQKLPSMDAIPLSVEEQKSTTAKPLRLGSVSLKSRPPPVENESDVALAATKNLRRMLRLDPS